MLTKTLVFDDDILDILCDMEWIENGLFGKLTCGQLERDMYVKVNKALEAMGGKWNRKLGGHVFKTDPRGQVEGLLENGTLTVEKDGFFETPEAVVNRMMELVPLKFTVLIMEPSAGLGAIIKKLYLHGATGMQFIAIEKNFDRVQELKKLETKGLYCMDFLKYERVDPYWAPKLIYMNPPFEERQDVDHVKHAYEVLADGGSMVSVMAESAFFRQDKKSVEFREWLKVVGGQSEKLPAGSFKESGTMVNARLVVIHK